MEPITSAPEELLKTKVAVETMPARFEFRRIPKEVYRFSTHEEAGAWWEQFRKGPTPSADSPP